MNIWVTGCSGFLGSRLTRALRLLGHRVVGLSRRPCPLADVPIGIDLASNDASEKLRRLRKSLGAPDFVVHTAGRKPGPADIAEYVKSNVLTLATILDSFDGLLPRQFIYASTLSVYGRPDANPVSEAHPARANSPYPVTKRWGEELAESFQDRTQVIVLRLPSLYGAGQLDSFVDGLARLAMRNEVIELFGRGDIVRDALHVEDVVGAIATCVTEPPLGRYWCMNLGCGQRITTREYAQALVEVLDSRSQIVAVDRPSPQEFDLYANIGEARRQIGFHPTDLPVSIRRYSDELRANS